MKNTTSRTAHGSASHFCRLNGFLFALTSLTLTLGLTACSKPDDSQTAAKKLDAVIAKTGQAAQEAKLKTEQSAAQAKAKTEEVFASAGEALKSATQKAELSAKSLAGKAIENMDDMAITAAISAELVKDPALSAFKINVDTKNGAVTLHGSAPTEAARERAGAIAKTFSGVQSVDNKLTVKPG